MALETCAICQQPVPPDDLMIVQHGVGVKEVRFPSHQAHRYRDIEVAAPFKESGTGEGAKWVDRPRTITETRSDDELNQMRLAARTLDSAAPSPER